MTYESLLQSKPVTLVEFFASWCPHCHAMMPVVEQVKELLGDRAAVHQFDIDENQQLADEQDVQSVPTFILYDNAREVWRHSGEMDGTALLSKIEQYLR